MFEDLGPLRDSIRDVIFTSDVDMGMICLTLYGKTHCKANHTNVLVSVDSAQRQRSISRQGLHSSFLPFPFSCDDYTLAKIAD